MKTEKIIQEEAIKFGVTISKNDTEYIIWEHTGYPSFWRIGIDGDTAEECFRTQIREFFKSYKM